MSALAWVEIIVERSHQYLHVGTSCNTNLLLPCEKCLLRTRCVLGWGIDTTGFSTQAWEALPTDGRGGGEGSMLLRSINIKDVINRFAQITGV